MPERWRLAAIHSSPVLADAARLRSRSDRDAPRHPESLGSPPIGPPPCGCERDDQHRHDEPATVVRVDRPARRGGRSRHGDGAGRALPRRPFRAEERCARRAARGPEPSGVYPPRRGGRFGRCAAAAWGLWAAGKLLALFAIVYVLLKNEIVTPLGFLIGYLALPLGIVAAQLFGLKPGIDGGEKSS